MKLGSSDQNTGPNSKLIPGQPDSGTPIQAASATRWTSYSPNRLETSEPMITPMTSAQSRSTPVAFSAISTTASKVMRALIGAPNRIGCGGYVFEQIPYDRHDGNRNQHDHRAGYDRRQHTPQEGEPRRQRELEQGGSDHQGGEHRRTALHQGGNADGDEGARRAHGQHVAGAEPAHANGLNYRAQAADDHRREHGPVEIGFAAIGGADDDGGRQYDSPRR